MWKLKGREGLILTTQHMRPFLAALRSHTAPLRPSLRLKSSIPFPVLPYDPLRPLNDQHPAPLPDNFVHPLAKWDNFLDIRSSCLPSFPHTLSLLPCLPFLAEDPSLQQGQVLSNDPPIIPQRFPKQGSASDDQLVQKEVLAKMVGLDQRKIDNLCRFTMAHHRVVHQTRGGRV